MNDRPLTASEFLSRAREKLTFDVPAGFADPNVLPRHDQQDADAEVVAAIAARPIRLAGVLVSIIERDEPSVLFTQRTAHLADHAGQISFPGGKIDASDESPAAAALREAEEEIALPRRFVDSHDPLRPSHRASALPY
jgi:8-oxo-dGTP pyrophosphatase MutT (NUDIX family)